MHQSNAFDPPETKTFDRLLPHSIEAERGLLGSLMLAAGDKASFAESRGIVNRESFYLVDHQVLWDAILQLHDAGQPVDAISVRENLRRKNLYEEIGGDALLGKILNCVPSAAHYQHYAKIIAGKWKMLKLIQLSNDMLRAAYAPNDGVDDLESADEVVSKFVGEATKIAISSKGAEVYSIADVLPEVLAMRQTGNSRLIPTGIGELDRIIGGLGFGLKHVVGAFPGVGKSATLKKFARDLAGNGIHVGFISIEEKRQKIVANLLSGESGVLNNRIQFGTASREEWDNIESAADKIRDLPFHIVDSLSSISSIVSMAHLLVAKHGCRAIFIDHDHIIDAEVDKGRNREQEVAKISKALKQAWKELDVIGIEACQLNESAGKDRPTLASLRDSRTLAADADVILLLHREDYHHRNEPGYTRNHILEVIVAKNKDGASSIVPLYYDEARYLICEQENGRPIFNKQDSVYPSELM